MSPQQCAPHPPANAAASRGITLAWIERRGLLDLALAAALALQWRLSPYPPCTKAHLSSENMMGQIIPPVLTWLILGAGGLAPLTRRRAARPGELPAGAGLWVAAYALMALCWFGILMNGNPDELWCMFHLNRMERGDAALWALLIPALLAPGWRRLARAMRLAWLRRRRRAASRAGDGLVSKKIGGRLRLGLLIALGALYAWALTDNAIMSDGFGIIHTAESARGLEPKQYREPGTLLLLRAAAHALRPLGLNAAQAIHLTNSAAMLATLALLGWTMHLMGLGRRQRGAGWWLILSSLGITQMALGRVELYPLVELSVTATVTCALAALRGRLSPGWMAAAFALGLAGHLSVVFILPGVLLTLWLWARPIEAISSHPQSAFRNPQLNNPQSQTLLRGFGLLLGWGALIHLPLWGWLMTGLEDATPRGLVQAVLGSLNTGAQGAAETKLGTYTLAGKLARLFEPGNLLKPGQVLFYLAGGALLTALLGAGAHLTRSWRAAERPGAAARRDLAVLGAAFGGYLVYVFTWPNDWSWFEDWDLFSGVTPLAALLTLRWLAPAEGAWRLPPALVRRLCLFALLLALSQHVYNHNYASYLNFSGKATQSRDDGLLIQRYQLQHGWKRFHTYAVENGRVIETNVTKMGGSQ